MPREDIVMVCCSDIAGQVRGKGLLARDLHERREKGVGWTPTNIMITAHGAIADTPWGPFGDLILKPDLDTLVRVDFGDDGAPEHFVLGDIRHLDGTAWACCPRDFLRRGLDALKAEAGLTLKASFEHEFHYDGVEEVANSGYALDAYRRQGVFAETFLDALQQAAIIPDTFMPEYGPCQYEVTVEPKPAMRSADEAVILRQIARATAFRLGHRASFTPILRPDSVGNGLHVHFSLHDAETGKPVNHDPSADHGVSATAAHFLAGILDKLPVLTALTAATPISYLRLVPNRWSAAYTNLGVQDREASLRICPVFETTGVDVAKQFHFEYRAADAAATPYFVLGAIVWAGVHGLRAKLPRPEPTETDPGGMTAEEFDRCKLARLPRSLSAALDLLEADEDAKGWLGPELHDAYLRHKRFEDALMADLPLEEQCARYHKVF
ncbi:glutamine synthetase [Kaustia mangrovi]|uniref:Glutamine synthetase n=1 Tax=Kaustia mangrovi TaxID=2593653 RepID=A0A7S8C2X4_9HYPH|nr:glutamine synthetase family protein [Kaustia mangrovi]QPC42380.1 glutamine synthetase [Kaustia mangrovi]